MSIYIAKGDETLGPYTPRQAADLIRRGHLRADDFAARNGDAGWVALSTLLAAEPLPTEKEKPGTGGVSTGPQARRVVGVGIFLGLAVLLAVGAWRAGLWPARTPAPRFTGQPKPAFIHPAKKPVPSPAETPSAATPATVARPGTPPPTATPEASRAVVVAAATPTPATPPPAKKDCRLNGTVSLGSPGGKPVRFADVRVAAYALEGLLPFLAGKDAHVQGELARLAPQLAAANAEKNRRAGLAKDAQQAYLDASPADPLRASLRFAAAQARADVTTATTDYQYLLGQRDEIMDGDFYFRDLPAPTAQSQTNAEGEFALDLPAGGAYALAARVKQTGLGDTRTRYWLVKAVLEDGSQHSLVLSEANVASAGAPESLIHTSN